MSASNNRVKDQDTVHHILNRIAHRVYFLGDDERNDFIEMIRRAAEYCGIKVLAWCVLTNHFHLMIHLPVADDVGEEEVLRRYGVLKGRAALDRMSATIDSWRSKGEHGEQEISRWLAVQRRRMYDVGEFMKIVKQWFTEEYNRRHSHVGTLWESEYQDKPVKMTVGEMSKRMGYIHLNPIRAAAVATFDGYAWSSFYAFVRGDEIAEFGMRFVYDDFESSVADLKERHLLLLEKLLEDEKKRRAEEIARKRAAGYEMPVDHLTSEAMVAQATAQLEKVRRAAEEMRIADVRMKVGLRERRKMDVQAILDRLRLHPTLSAEALAAAVGISVPSVYNHLRALKKQGVIERCGREEPWEIQTL